MMLKVKEGSYLSIIIILISTDPPSAPSQMSVVYA